jgi:TRAP-type transport system small permease protein
VQRLFDLLVRAMHVMGAVFVLLVMAMILFDVTGRFLFNAPFHGTDVLAANAMFFIAFLQLPLVLWQRGLLRVTILYGAVPGRAQMALDLLTYALTTALFLLLAWNALHGLEEALRNHEFEGTLSFRIPTAPVRAAAVVLWCVAALVSFGNIVDRITGGKPKSYHKAAD